MKAMKAMKEAAGMKKKASAKMTKGVGPTAFFREASAKTVAGWHAQINRGGKRMHSPRFDSESAATLWLEEHLAVTPAAEPEQHLAVTPTREPAVKRRLTAKTSPTSLAERIEPQSGIAAAGLEQERAARVTAEARLKELEEEVERGNADVTLWKHTAARCAELEDANDWFQCCARANAWPPPTLMRRGARPAVSDLL